ncbi:Putative F-box/LRR-repeat protein At5g02700 [Linum grandiflorum]
MEGRRILRTAADRISNLPDEVIHEILCRLRSPKQPAQLAILSKRWTHLWISYPVLELDIREWPIAMREKNMKKFLTAAAKKFLDLQQVPAVRLSVQWRWDDPDLCDKLLGFVAKVTQELCLRFYLDVEYYIICQPLLNRFCNLKVVKLRCVHFPSGCSVRFGASLQVLSLKFVKFPYPGGDGILNSMIESASSSLETLTLSCISGIERLQIQDSPNLKTLKAVIGNYLAAFKISGVESLKILHVPYWNDGRFEVLLAPNNNVKVLEIVLTEKVRCSDEELNKFILKFPRLESLKLFLHQSASEVLKINVNNHKLLRSIRMTYDQYEWPKVIEIDAPSRFSNFIFGTMGIYHFPTILVNKAGGCHEAASKQVSVHCRLPSNFDWDQLKQFLAKSSQFRLTLEFSYYWECDTTYHTIEQGSNVPVIEQVILPEDLFDMSDPNAFIMNLLRCCHPKILSLAKSEDEEIPEKHMLAMKELCEKFNIINL